MKNKLPELERTLQEWQVTTPLPPRFREQVWNKIERREAPSISLAEALRAWISIQFARPAFALAYVTVLLIAGLTLGVRQAHVTSARLDRQLEARYVQTLDPYQRMNVAQ